MVEKYEDLPQNFNSVTFRGTFRDYQQTVLDHAGQYLDDGKIHIVAAPGSGKTVLGLELIRRLGKPALVLSPSIPIRQQWGDRFEERFLPEQEQCGAYISFDLKRPRLITSVSYQALYAAAEHLLNEESLDIFDEEALKPSAVLCENVEVEDFRGFDLVEKMRQANIGVLCLDEAHHLRSEWHKALASFIKAYGGNLTIIALTATPPYDSTSAEWKRYETLCGLIDEEIFVPELVLKNTLCPHQDYIYFNYPTTKERKILKKYQQHAKACLQEIKEKELLGKALQATGFLSDLGVSYEIMLKNEVEFFTLFRMAAHFEVALPEEINKLMSFRKHRIKQTPWRKSWKDFEKALQFVIDKPDIFTLEVSEEARTILARRGLLERRRVKLFADAKLKRMLASSMGKMQGIAQIAISESAHMGDSLRMLILTDYIKKEMLSMIGTDAVISTMGAVPIFETVRRAVGEGMRLALLSGSLVIIPYESRETIAAIAKEKAIPCTFKNLAGVDYCEVILSGSNKNKVSVMTEAFQKGAIHILVGTKSLLGEGWDSPCINAVILATFVGSFMLSNQMRGRAIRVDHKVPDKTANIWHLVTIEPVIDPDASLEEKLLLSGFEQTRELDGEDWETLIRRFDCFMGPAYQKPTIESGVERIDILLPPFDQRGIGRINEEMVKRAHNRAAMAKSWTAVAPAGFYPVVERVSEVSKVRLPMGFVFQSMAPFFALVIVDALLGYLLQAVLLGGHAGGVDRLFALVLLGSFVGVSILLVRLALRVGRFLSPKKRIASIAETLLVSLRQAGHIRSLGAKIRVKTDPANSIFLLGLRLATIQEQNIFAQAIKEMLSPIESPKYVLIKTKYKKRNKRKGDKHYLYFHSYACPTILSANKEDAELLCENLSHLEGNFDLVFTYNEKGRKVLWKSCCRSYVNINSEMKSKLMAQEAE